MIFNQSPQAIDDLEAHQVHQITKNEATFSKKRRQIPAKKVLMVFYLFIAPLIILVESIAVALAYGMLFEGQE